MNKNRPYFQYIVFESDVLVKGAWPVLGRKEKNFRWEELGPDDRMKYEIAEELGLLEKVKREGWKSLSAKETGRIGGLMTRKKREMKRDDKDTDRGG